MSRYLKTLEQFSLTGINYVDLVIAHESEFIYDLLDEKDDYDGVCNFIREIYLKTDYELYDLLNAMYEAITDSDNKSVNDILNMSYKDFVITYV